MNSPGRLQSEVGNRDAIIHANHNGICPQSFSGASAPRQVTTNAYLTDPATAKLVEFF